MLILDSPYTDPRYNIAAEEYLLKETGEDYAFFYINEPSIIIGKHQNAYAEVNLDFVRKNQIKIIRRISGGGTVWHDRGNLNFSFILNGEEGKQVNFRGYAKPVVDFLNELGVKASFGPRNEILAGDFKISGNAEHIHRKRVLHHGTLLFDSDLDSLAQSLRVDLRKYQDKAVKSVRSEVSNVRESLGKQINMESFRSSLINYFLDIHKGSSLFILGGDDEYRIKVLAEEKYSSWSWNIGYSPRYRLIRECMLDDLAVSLNLSVEKGIIREIHLVSEGLDKRKCDAFMAQLTGAKHDPEIVDTVCREVALVKPDQIENFVYSFF